MSATDHIVADAAIKAKKAQMAARQDGQRLHSAPPSSASRAIALIAWGLAAASLVALFLLR